jgi:hypothetical protein
VYPPSAILRSAGLDPAEVGARCGLNDVDAVPVRPAPGWMRRGWSGWVGAMTLPWAIYVRPEQLRAGGPASGRLLVHELVHVRQWRQLGTRRFAAQYLRDYLRGRRRGLSHRDAYLAVSFEQEARTVAGL